MTHKAIQKYFLSYLDGELEEKRYRQIEHHLENCGYCRGRLEGLRRIYQKPHYPHRKSVPPFLFTRIQEQLREKTHSHSRTGLKPLMVKLQPLITGALLFIAALLGYLLGDIPSETREIQTSAMEQTLQQVFNIEVFTAIPPQSLGRAMLTIYERPEQVMP